MIFIFPAADVVVVVVGLGVVGFGIGVTASVFHSWYGGRCIKPHDKIITGDVFPSLCPGASQMLRNERRRAAVRSWKCHVLLVALLHKEVVFSKATEVDSEDGLSSVKEKWIKAA